MYKYRCHLYANLNNIYLKKKYNDKEETNTKGVAVQCLTRDIFENDLQNVDWETNSQ